MTGERWGFMLQILVLAASVFSTLTSLTIRNEVLQMRIDVMKEINSIQIAARSEFPSRQEFEQLRERLNRVEGREYGSK